MRRFVNFALGVGILAGSLSVAPPALARDASPEPRIDPRVAATCDVGPSAGAGFAWGTAGGVVSDGAGVLAGASVYAINTETGAMTCDVTDVNGAYLLDLTGSGSPLRRAADYWLIVANPPLDSSLGSNSRVLDSTLVTQGASVPDMNLTLQAKTVSVVVTLDSDDTSGIACLYAEGGAPLPVHCSVTQEYTPGSLEARVSVPTSGSYYLDGWAYRGGVRLIGYYDDFVRGSTTGPITVAVEPEVFQPCQDARIIIEGDVTKDDSGVSTPAQAQVVGAAFGQDGWEEVIYTWSNPQGAFGACSPYLPGGTNAEDVLLGTSSIMGGPVFLRGLGGTTDDSRRALSLDLSAPLQLSGRITAGGQPVAGAEWNIAVLDENGLPGRPLFTTAPRTDAQGRWGLSGLFLSGTYALLAYPADDDTTRSVSVVPFTIVNGAATSFAGAEVSNGYAQANVALATGNVTGRAVKPDTSPQAFSLVRVAYCSVDDEVPCQVTGTRTNSDGRFAVSLPTSGTYVFTLTIQPRWSDSGVAATTTSGTIVDGVTTPLNITMQVPNGVFRLVDATGDPIPDGRMNLMAYTGNWQEPWDGQNSQGSEVNGQGLGYFSIDDSSIYRLTVYPGATFGPTVDAFLLVEVGNDGSLTIQSCPRPVGDMVPCASGTSPFSQTDGAWEIERPVANISGVLKAPDGGLNVADGQIQIQKIEGQGPRWFGDSSSNQNGLVALYLPSGDYSLTFAKPRESQENWSSRTYYLTVDGANACLRDSEADTCAPSAPITGEEFTLLTANVIGTVQSFTGQSVANGWVEVFTSCGEGCQEWLTGAQVSNGTFSMNLPAGASYTLAIQGFGLNDGSVRSTFDLDIAQGETYTPTFRLKGANVSGRVSGANDSSIQGAQIQVERKVDMEDYVRWEWANSWTQTDSNGDFSLNVSAGTYRLRVQPPPGDLSLTAGISDEFTLSSADDTAIVNISLGAPNVVGNVQLPGGIAPGTYSWVEARAWNADTEQYEWSESIPGASTDAEGIFAMSLPDGRWELIANPPWGDSSASRTSVEIVVSGSFFCAGTGPCTEEDSVTAPAGIAIVLMAPNVSGVVLLPDNSPASNTWIDVRRYDVGTGRYDWSPELQGINVNPNGTYSTTLGDGDYRLTANPPWGNSTVTRASVDVTVDGDAVCLTSNKNTCDDSAIAQGQLVIALGSPNVQGTVQADGQAVANSNLNVEKWDDAAEQWRWQEIWGNSSSAGAYSFNFSDDGVYRITAQPTSLTRDFSTGRAYVYLDSGQLCSPADENSATGLTPCSPAAAPLDLDINLSAADLLGTVTDGTSGLRDAWVSLLKMGDEGWYDWVGGTSTRSGGSFALALETGGGEQQYRLEVFPPWGGQGDLSRKTVNVIAYDDAGTTRVCAESDWTGSACSAAVSRLTITLTSGNVRGFVKVPGAADTGVREAQISVEKWVEAPWNPGSGQFVWNWADTYTDSRAGGAFALPLEDAGTYRLTVRPPYANTSGWSSGKAIITVNGSGEWCEQDDATGTTSDAFGACEGPVSSDSSRLTVRLSTPNVAAQVRNGGLGVQDAWVSLMRETVKVIPGGSNDDTYISRDWIAGAPTNATGNFYMNVDRSGTYILEVNPPWQTNNALSRFQQAFTVTCSSSCVVSGLPATLDFPSANVGGQILDPANSAVVVSNAWVSVEKEVSAGVYTWTDQGTATNGRGRYVLALGDGTYRLTANPAWNRPVGVPKQAIVTVTSGVATCVSGCLTGFDIQLQSANVSGSLAYGSPSAPMPFGWIEVTDPDTGDFVAGTSSGQQGTFSLYLPDDTYTFRAYPNWNIAAKPPVSTTVVVSGGQVTAVGGQAAATVDLDFDAVTPSLVLTVGGNVSGKRFIAVEKWVASSWVAQPDLTAVTSSGQARFVLEVGTYRLTVVPDIGKSSTDNSVDVVISDPSVTIQSTVNPTES